jgi:uncharacterized membrane protein
MKNFRNLIFALMIMVGVSMADSTGIWFAVSMGLCLVPAIVLGIEEIRKQKAYEEAKQKSNNIDYLLDCVEFGEWEMN